MDYITLNDGNKIPAIGFGVFLIPNDGPTYDAVLEALKAGYRHIDTAAAYFNEEDVGKAVRDSGIPREEIFVTSKLWLQDHGYEAAKKGIARSLRKLGLDYIDLYLVHQPYGDVAGAWKAMEEAKEDGKIKSIGVSNMSPALWNKFVPAFTIKPAVNQVEFNPLFQQKEIRRLMAQTDTKLEAWYPLGHGNADLLSVIVLVCDRVVIVGGRPTLFGLHASHRKPAHQAKSDGAEHGDYYSVGPLCKVCVAHMPPFEHDKLSEGADTLLRATASTLWKIYTVF